MYHDNYNYYAGKINYFTIITFSGKINSYYPLLDLHAFSKQNSVTML